MHDSYGNNPFKVNAPSKGRVPFVFNSPHSGRFYSPEFLALTKLNNLAIRKSEDFMVDKLFASAPEFGAHLLSANFPRAWLDVNREPYELDPNMIEGPLPSFLNTNSIRVAGGLGTIAKIVADSEEIYSSKLPIEDMLNRIDTLYKPYHEMLRTLLSQNIITYGHAVLVDCHSMPSARTRSAKLRSNYSTHADFVIGNRFGTSCAPELTQIICDFLTDFGYHVAVNKPYAGGFITEHYGRPESGLHAIQIEVNRGLYMDELKMQKNAHFNQLTQDISSLCNEITSIPDYFLKGSIPLAAE